MEVENTEASPQMLENTPVFCFRLSIDVEFNRYHQRDDAVLGSPELGMNDWFTFVSASLQIQATAVRTRLILQRKVCDVCSLPCSITRKNSLKVGYVHRR